MRTIAALAAVLVAGSAFLAHAADDAAAEALARKAKCTKCHSVDKEKGGPSYSKIAAKYKGQADAERKLVTHLTTSPKVKVDGAEETHDDLKAAEPDVRNVVRWILTR